MEQKFGKNSIDIEALREFCEREGKEETYRKGDQLEREGDPARWVGRRGRLNTARIIHEAQEFPVEVDADGWRRLYQTAIRQSLVGVCYQGVCLLPEGSKPLAAFRDGVHRIAADASVRHE